MSKTTYIDFKAVKANVDFLDVLSHYGITPTGRGKQIKINCPFHTDKTPSCGINLDRGLFNCFSCQSGGHVIDFVLRMEDLNPDDAKDRQQAAHLTVQIGGYDPDGDSPEPAKPKAKAKPRKRTAKAKDEPTDHNPPLDLSKISMELEMDHLFFDDHGITDDMIDTFGLGYTSTGILKGRIVIPIYNVDDQIVAFAGRHASQDVPDDVPRYKLPKAFHKSLELFNLNRAITLPGKHITIVEGYWSTMRLHLHGIPCVATMGTSISPEQVELLTAQGYRYATVIFDGDDQGRSGAQTVVDHISQHLYVRRFDLPDGIKPDTMSDDWLARLTP
ncbi:CHC2 zinc finger domain-containing protein [Planktomarina temperata]|nr:CHC2 zinc finger domain-containing protein [Planktomarina temperata]